MKSVSPGMASHIQGGALTLARLWRLVRKDGSVFCFTSHDQDIVYGGETYLSAIGYQSSAMGANADLAVGGGDLLGMLNSDALDPVALRAGVWDFAAVRLFDVNWANPALGEIKVARGTLGEVTARDDGTFIAEFRSMAQPLQQTVGSLYQPTCRAQLGDARCKIDLSFGAGWTQAGEIAAVTNGVTLVLTDATDAFGDAYFTLGVAIWQSGTNAGVAREVLAWNQSARTLTLFAPPPFAPAPGDTLHIQPGCDQLWATCKDTFGNRLNFRGEPFVPGALAVVGTGV